MPTEWRVLVEYANGKRSEHKKKSYEKALADVEQLIEERKHGRLAPFWDGAKIQIQSREVSLWKTSQA
jgi:hypothetical protein